MIVFLLIWNIVLTLALALAVLANLGKFSRVERGFFEENQEFSKNLENLRGEFSVVQADLKNLAASFENLPKTSETLEEVLQQIQQLETKLSNLAETQGGLRKDVDLLLRSTDEHPVLLPVERNKGGRPRKALNIMPTEGT